MCNRWLFAEAIKRVLKDYHSRIAALEDKKFDLEYVVKRKDYEVLDNLVKERRILAHFYLKKKNQKTLTIRCFLFLLSKIIFFYIIKIVVAIFAFNNNNNCCFVYTHFFGR